MLVDTFREFLVETAKKVGIEGAEELLSDPNNGVTEVCFLNHVIISVCSVGYC